MVKYGNLILFNFVGWIKVWFKKRKDIFKLS